jgi:hypothetical protein
MSTCIFPDVVALPFSETLPDLQLGLASMVANESPALGVFSRVVLREAARLDLGRQEKNLPREQPRRLRNFPLVPIAPRPVVHPVREPVMLPSRGAAGRVG